MAFPSEHQFPFLLSVHDVCLILPDEQVAAGLDDVEMLALVLPRALACKSFKSSDGHDLLSTVLDVLSSWSFGPLPILGSL